MHALTHVSMDFQHGHAGDDLSKGFLPHRADATQLVAALQGQTQFDHGN